MKNEDLHTYNELDELNFVDHWAEVTVQTTVSKGAILRQQKIKQSTYRKVHDIANIYDEPSTSRSNQMHQVFRVKKDTAYCTNRRGKVPSFVLDYRKPESIEPGKTKSRYRSKRCPIRIAELAVPSKRQCLDTWKNSFKVIPYFMVERLKQRVMDEKPIVLIADAVNCFEKRKTRLRKRTLKKQYLDVKHTGMRELQLLCAIFGYRVALKLRRPINLSLNAGLEKINNIVKGEIDTMLRYKNNSRQKINKELLEEISRNVTVWIDSILEESQCNLLTETLQELEEEEGPALDVIDALVDEILIICEPPSPVKTSSFETELSVLSEKSAEGLIANITEVNIDQLITDLYTDALKNAERQILEKHDDYLTGETSSGQQQIELSNYPNSEYVAENVRGELNKLVDQMLINLITADNRSQDVNYSKDSSEEIGQESNQELTKFSNEFEENYNDTIQTSKVLLVKESNLNATEDTNATAQAKTSVLDLKHNENDTIVNDFKDDTNESAEIVKEIMSDFLNTNVWNLEPSVLMTDDNITKADDIEVILKQDTPETINVTEDGKNELFVKDNESKEVEADNIMQFHDVEKEDSVKGNETEQLVKEVLITIFEYLAIEPPHDENETFEDNKKVKFSAIDMGIGVNKNLLTKLSGQELILQTPSTDYLKLNIDFAPPNENLLSNADESWPQNIGLPIIKVTESVNKSVTSLGKIFELDEKGISSENSYFSVQHSEMLIDVQLASMSMDNSKSNNMLLTPLQNETEIVAREKTRKIEKEKSQKTDMKKLSIKKSPIKLIVKSRDVRNKTNNASGKNLTKPTNVQKLDKKYIKAYNKEEQPKKDKRTPYTDKVSNKTDRTKVSENRRNVTKNKINRNITSIKQKTQITPEIVVKKAEINKDTLDVVSKEDRGDGFKNEHKHEVYSCEKLFSKEQKTKSKQSGIIKIDAYDILKWCKGLENVIENLETWNAWINSTCKCIIYLKQRGNYKSSKSMEKARRKWKMLHRNIKQDRILWRDMKLRNRDGLKSYKKYYDMKNGATKYQVCDCSNNWKIKNE